MEFCEKLKLLREEEGLSQSALAKALGVSQSAVAQWEAGTRKPTAQAVVAIARMFDTSADFILGLVDEKLRLVPYYKGLDEKEQTFMQAYSQLSVEKKNAVGEIVRLFLSE
ncbi:MAG TPA: helix-turn-helix transcriptional regulator [Candidatus Ornithoclostridium faecavium]|nr:helix-turn-helix transcriptional regulator [Candidatus Ornithoclostridium faecavium]